MTWGAPYGLGAQAVHAVDGMRPQERGPGVRDANRQFSEVLSKPARANRCQDR